MSYTVRFAHEEALRLDELLIELRRETGRRLDKSEVIRTLLRLASDDSGVRGRLVDEIDPGRAAE